MRPFDCASVGIVVVTSNAAYAKKKILRRLNKMPHAGTRGGLFVNLQSQIQIFGSLRTNSLQLYLKKTGVLCSKNAKTDPKKTHLIIDLIAHFIEKKN